MRICCRFPGNPGTGALCCLYSGIASGGATGLESDNKKMPSMKLILPVIALCVFSGSIMLPPEGPTGHKMSLQTGAEQTDQYVPYLRGKRVAILANPTSVIGKTHLVDSLQSHGIDIVKVFGPEHGFRGNASAGARVTDEIDSATGIPIISLYGKKNKPTKEDLANVDIVIYDLQDVGCRFYTNINALVRLMEACDENDKELVILDRPNPNAYFIDGPVLDMKLK